MNRKFPLTLMSTAVTIVLLCPLAVRAQGTANSQTSNDTSMTSSADNYAMSMEPARAALNTRLDAKKDQVGQEFQATLSDTVHLKNGPELPHGTRLMGTVVVDDAQAGSPTLALRFTKAQLKNGQVVPIKAVIVGFSSPGDGPATDLSRPIGDTPINSQVKIDAVGIISGVDLHSAVDGNNSGSFVATKKTDIHLASGSQFALAIAARQAGA